MGVGSPSLERARPTPGDAPIPDDVIGARAILADGEAFAGSARNVTLPSADSIAKVRIGSRFVPVAGPITGGVAVEFPIPFTPDNLDERVRP